MAGTETAKAMADETRKIVRRLMHTVCWAGSRRSAQTATGAFGRRYGTEPIRPGAEQRQARSDRDRTLLLRHHHKQLTAAGERPASRGERLSSTVFVRVRRDAEIELLETLRVEKRVDLDDLPVGDGEGHH